MSIISTSTIWQLVCPVTATNGLVSQTTRSLPPNFTPTATYGAVILASSAAAMSVIEGSSVPTGTLPPADTFGPGGGPRLTVAVPIHTTLIVDVFPNPIPTPIQTYRPGWDSTGDGSLITPVYQAATKHDHARIILMGALLAIFVRNVFVAIDYLRRGRARDKTLFYLLLASQLWGPVAFSAIIAGILSRTASCTVINILTVVAMEASSSLLVTGILGIKAYRCLNRSRIVLFITWALQVASIVLFLLDLVRTSSVRAFNGTCAMNNDAAEFIPAWISVMFSETGFLSLCFLLAAWRSSKSPAAQGRLSLIISQPSTDSHISIVGFPTEDEAGRRGWWDYVPTAHSGPQAKPPPAMDQLSPLERVQSGDSGTPILLNGTPQPRETMRSGVRRFLIRLFSSIRRSQPQHTYPRKPSTLGPYPLPQPPREAAPPSREKASPLSRGPIVRFTPDHAASLESGWSKRLPNMLRSVIRNELFYTTAVTFSCVVSAIIVSSAARSNLLFDPLVWLQINWAVTSWLVMRSYDQVIQRHEREKILQEPFINGNAAVADVTRQGFWRDHQSVSSTLSSRSSWRNGHSLDEDRLGPTHRRQPTTLSNNTMMGIAREYSNPFHDFQSVVTHEPSRENDGKPSRPRPDSVGTGEDLVREAFPPPAWSDSHRTINAQGRPPLPDPRIRPPLPRLDTNSPELPAFTFEFTSPSPLSESPPRAPRRGRPPGVEPTSADSPIGIASSTNLRSPTTVSFDHSVGPSDSAGITRRSRSNDWGRQPNP
ncbi:hypothetical protein FS837_000304 [Tulasnella sp. UAMH 9824]|nr:hypothetical protein FS837_000304 [Tulasnella sp. UAMH 9824]